MLLSTQDQDLLLEKWRILDGYPYINLSKLHTGGLIHRIIMERVIGRKLLKEEEVDHINGIRNDNRRENLRVVTRSVNQRNRHKCWSKSGYFGVSKIGNRWRSRLTVKNNRRSFNLFQGYFSTAEEAALAYNAAAEKAGYETRNVIN